MKPHFLVHIVYGALLVLVSLISDAQIYIKTKSISTDDGLSDKRVTCFFKDKTGFIWIGTNNGLNRLMVTLLKSFVLPRETLFQMK